MIDNKKLLERVDELIALANRSIASGHHTSYGVWVDRTVFNELRSASLSFIALTYGTEHPYYSEFDKGVESIDVDDSKKAVGILTAIRNEIAGGWLTTVRGLIAAEFFADFLEMADHLREQGYKDPAAVLAGSVLEEHLRQLAGRNGVAITENKNGKDVYRKADSLNADLTKATAYNVLEQKSVTSWLDLRNKAAHGHYGEYTGQQVEQMVDGIRGFMTRHPT